MRSDHNALKHMECRATNETSVNTAEQCCDDKDREQQPISVCDWDQLDMAMEEEIVTVQHECIYS